jgi:hypothetical protein
VCNEIFQGWAFTDAVKAAKMAGRPGWISVETFDCSFPAERIMTESMQFMQTVIAKICP